MKKILVLISACIACWIILGFSQQTDLIFSHKFHAEEAGAKCADCHQAVFTSTSPKDNLLPAMQTCYNCHDEKETDCKVCHSDPETAGEVPRIVSLAAKFAHQQHVKSEEDCKSCHAGVEVQVTPSGSKHIPSVANCTECHAAVDYDEDKASCLGCHEQNHPFKPADHTRVWKKDHGLVAHVNTEACGHCHQNSYCIQCHEGDNLDRLAHPLNYRSLHGIDARTNKESCLTCHQESAFCIECHQAEMVMPRNHAYANWTNSNDGGMHKRQAESDLDYCMSCHNDAYAPNVCIECHQ